MGEEGSIYFFDIFLYYFINVIIKTYIGSFCCCVCYIFYIWFILMCFALLMRSLLLATRNIFSRTIFDLDGWNTHHFVGNLIANSAAVSKNLFSICFQKKITQNHKQLHKNIKFGKKIYNIFLNFICKKLKKWELLHCVLSLCKWNKIINFVLSVKL